MDFRETERVETSDVATVELTKNDAPAAPESGAESKAAAPAAKPVSYTHLDVYKRQVVEALRMVGIVGIGRGDAGEEILIGFAGGQIAVLQGFLAADGQQRIARRIGDHLEPARMHLGPRRIDELCGGTLSP